MQLTNEQMAAIVSWAKKTLEVEAVFLPGRRSEWTARLDSESNLALSIIGDDPFWRLATFLSQRRAWRAELKTTLHLPVQLERARAEPSPEAGYVELWSSQMITRQWFRYGMEAGAVGVALASGMEAGVVDGEVAVGETAGEAAVGATDGRGTVVAGAADGEVAVGVIGAVRATLLSGQYLAGSS